MNLTAQFKEFLLNQSNVPSKVTVKNYVSDLNRFINWFSLKFNKEFSPSEIDLGVIELFKKELLTTHSASSIERNVSSLRKFFHFLKMEGQISRSPFEPEARSQKPEADPWHLHDFKNNLYVFNASHLTIKNYIIDIKQFINWAEQALIDPGSWENQDSNLISRITPEVIEEYKKRLLNEMRLSPVSVNRKLSSLRKYFSWAASEGVIKGEVFKVPQVPKVSEGERIKVPFDTSDTFDTSTPRAYSKFPPLRLLQKSKNGLVSLFDGIFIYPLVELKEKIDLAIWSSRGRPVFFSAGKQLSDISHRPLAKISNISKSFYAPTQISTANFPFHRKIFHHIRYTRPYWYKRYQSYAIVPYFHMAILMLLVSVLGYAIYSNINPDKPQPKTLAALPSAPPRILSFQGRLTDAQGNPITSQTPLRMTIYNSSSASGSALLWQEVISPLPDEDGIFNVILGKGTAIPQSLFAENSALFLGVTVGQTPELKPRQQIATVAFAANAESLQGLLPITATSATSNVILALNSSGNLTIGGTASPVFQATGGAFTVSGKTLVLNTTTGSNGDVQIVPDGTGGIDVQKALKNTSNNGKIIQGAVEVHDLFVVLATSSSQAAFNIHQNGTNNLITASVSGITRFFVGNSGAIYAGGNLEIDGGSSDIAGTLNLSGSSLTSTSNLTINAAGYTRIGDTASPSNASGDDDLFVEGDIEADGVIYAEGTIDTQFTGDNAAIYGTTSTGVLSSATTSTANLCLVSGATTPSWASCNSAGLDVFWNQTSGALHPNNSTVDFLVGGQSTTSAKFSVLNINSGTPIASISANSGNIATYLTGEGNLQTTNSQTLALGGSTTGNITLTPYGATGLINILTGNLKVGNGTPGVTQDGEDAYIEGTFEVDGTTTLDGALDANGQVDLGDNGDTFSVDSLEFDVTAGTGAITINDGGDAGNITIEGTVLDINSLDFVGVGTITTTTLGLTLDSGSNTITIASTDTTFTTSLTSMNVGAAFAIQGSSYVRIGDTATPGSATGDDDLFVESDLEVDGTIYADGGISSASSASISGNLTLAGGTRSIQTTENNTLTIGGDTTGNITLSPLNGGAGSTLTANTVNLTLTGTTTITASSLATFTTAATLGMASTTTLNCSDCIDFDDMKDSLSVDTSTDINLGANALTIDLDSSGDFSIRDVTTDIATFADVGSIAFAPTSGQSLTVTLGSTDLANILTGNLKVGNGTPGVTQDGEDAYIEGTFEVDGTTTLDGALDANGQVDLGDNGDTFSVDSLEFDVTAGTGAITINDGGDLGAITIEGSVFDINSLDFVGVGTLTSGAGTNLTFTPGTTGDLVFSTDADTTATFNGSAEGTANVTLTAGDLTLTDGDLTLSGGEITATADDTTGTSFSFTGVNTTGDTLGIVANSLSSGTALAVSSTSTSFNGELLTLSKTGASGSTAFTSDVANVTYSQTFSGGVGLNSTGNVLDVSRAITMDNTGNTHTISGALVTIADSGTETNGDINNTSNVLSLAQNCGTGVTCSGAVLKIANSGTGADLALDNDETITNSTDGTITFGADKLTLTSTAAVSGTLFTSSYAGATTQTGALTGISFDTSTNVTVPNSSSGNQTGLALTVKDGGSSATAIGTSISGTADRGIDLSGLTISSGGSIIYNDTSSTIDLAAAADNVLEITNSSGTTSNDNIITLEVDANTDASDKILMRVVSDVGGTEQTKFSVDSDGDVVAGTISIVTDLTCTDCLDFTDFEDTLDLDANLTLNQTTSTWSQTFTGDTTVGLTYTANSLTTGTALRLTSSGTITSGGELLDLVGNSTTTGNLITASSTALTSGSVFSAAGPSGGTVGITGNLISLTSDVGDAGKMLSSTATIDSTAGSASGYNIYASTANSNATNANSAYGVYSTLSDAIALGNNDYGIYSTVSNTGANTLGTKSVYGVYGAGSNTSTGVGGSAVTYGGYFTATGDSGGTSTAYGIYSDVSGADTNYGLYIGNTGTGIDIRLQNGESIHNDTDEAIILEDDDGTDYASFGATTSTLTTTTLVLSGSTTITGTSLTLITGGATAIDFTEFDVSASTGSITINDGGDAGNISIEGSVFDINSLDFAAGGTITTGGTGDLTLTPAGGNIISGSPINIGHTSLTAAAYNYFADAITGNGTADGDSDLYIEDELEVDGTVTLGTTLNCTDCIDFDDISDSPTLDAATDVNLSTFDLYVDLTSTGVLSIRDVATAYWTFDDDSTVDVLFPAAGTIGIDASTTANTTTGGVIDLNVNSITASNVALNIDYVMNDGTTAAADLFGAKINLTQNDVDGDLFGLVITNAATTAVVGADDVECLLCLDNVENTAAVVSDAIRITNSGGTDTAITTGLDFDATGIVTDIELQNAETIDNNVDGTVSISGTTFTLSAATTLTASSLTTMNTSAAFTIAGTSYVRIGDTATPGTATGDDDLFVESDIEADGLLYIDGTGTSTIADDLDIAGTLAVGDNGAIGSTQLLHVADATSAVGSAATYTGLFTRTLTGTATVSLSNYGIYNSLTVNATDDQFSHSARGIYSETILSAGNTIDTLNGAYFTVNNNSSTLAPVIGNTATTSAGLQVAAINDVSGSLITTQYGALIDSYTNVDASGIIVTSNYGALIRSFENTLDEDGGITTGYGVYASAQDATTNYGVYGFSGQNNDHANPVTYASAYGVFGHCQAADAEVTITSCFGVRGYIDSTAGTITNGYGVSVANPLSTGTLSYNYGIHVADQTGGDTEDYGVYIAGADTYALYVAADDAAFLDDVFIGATTETIAAAGFSLDGDDLFVSGTAGVEGTIYTDTGLDINNSTLTFSSAGVVAGTLNIDSTAVSIADTDIAFDGATTTFTTTGDLTLQSGGGQILFADGDTFAIGGVAQGLAYNAISDSGGATGHSLASDDDLYIEGDLEVDGSFFADGAVTFGSTFSCTDCIDFDDLANSMTLDEATDINLSTLALNIDLDSTGDFAIRDVTTAIATFADTGQISFVPSTGTYFDITSTYSSATAAEGYGILATKYYSIADTGLKQNLRINTASTHTTGTQANLVGLLALNTGAGNGGTTTNSYGLWSRMDASTGHTVTNAVNYQINTGSVTGTITNQYGIIVGALTTGTDNAGILIGEATGTNQSNLVIGQVTEPTGTFSIYNSSTDDNYFAGKLGIGATAPGYNLEIENTADSAIFLEADTDNANEDENAFIKFSQDNTAVQAILGTVGDAGVDPENTAYTGTLANSILLGGLTTLENIHFGTNDTVRMTVAADGNVGIGDTTPDTIFEVNTSGVSSTDGILITNATDANYAVLRPSMSSGANNTIVQAGDQGIIFSGGTQDASDSNFVLAPWATGTSGMRMTYRGLIGFGTASPISELHVTRPVNSVVTGKALAIFDQIEEQDIFTASKSGVTKFTLANDGSASMAGTLTLGGTSGIIRPATGDLSLQYKSGGNAWTTVMTIDDVTGYIGIGDTTPDSPLELGDNKWITLNSLQSTSGINLYESGTKDATSIQYGATIYYDGSGDTLIIGTRQNSVTLSAISIARATGDLTLSGDLAVNGDDITSDVDLTLNPAGGDVIIASGDRLAIGGSAADRALTIYESAGTAVDFIHLRDTTDAADLVLRYDGTDSWDFYTELSAGGNHILGLETNGNVTLSGDLAVNGDDITSDGDLTISTTGNNVILQDGDTLNVGGIGAVAYNAIADSLGAATYASSDDDLYVEGSLESDGIVYFTSSLKLLSASAVIYFDDLSAQDSLGIKRITSNDGYGNWNFRGGYDGNVYLDTGDGAAGMELGFEGASGTVTFEVAGTGTAGNPVSLTQLTLNTTTLTWGGTGVTFSAATSLSATSLATFTTSATVSWATLTDLTFTADNITINGSDAASGDLYLEGTSNATKTTSYVLLQSGGGLVGIGTTSPGEELDVEGQIQLELDGTTDTTIGVCKDVADGAGVENDVEFRDCSSTPGDIAEWYAVENDSEAGDILATSDNTFEYDAEGTDYQGFITQLGRQKISVLKKADSNSGLIGVYSTGPWQTIGEDIKQSIEESGNPTIKPAPIALAGRTPIKVTAENGIIKKGDYIVLSSTPGKGMKATKAGYALGVALEDGDNKDKILAYVKPTFYDPDVQLADSGDLFIASSVQQLVNSFELRNTATNETITRIGAYSEVVSAKIRAGLIEAQETTSYLLRATSATIGELTTDSLAVVTENITIAGTNIRDYIANIVDQRIAQNTGSGNIISPIETEGENIIAKLPQNDSKLIVKNASGSAVAQIDSDGNASLSGKLVTDELETRKARSEELEASSATISGTLRASTIIADDFILSEEALIKLGASISAVASPSADSQSSIVYGQSVSSESATFQNLTVTQGLMSFGPTSLFEASIADRLFVGSQLSLADNAINVLGSNFEIQPLRQGGIRFLSGLVEIDREGNLKVDGNAYFAKDVEINGKLFANIIAPIPGRDLVIDLASGDSLLATSSSKFEIRNSSQSGVLAVDARGNLAASGSGTFAKLNLNIVGEAEAISDTEVIATGSAGLSAIKAYQNELTIINPLVNEKSLIYITPRASTGTSGLYLMRQTPGVSFTVGLDQIQNKDIQFNWIIIN